MAKLLSGSTLRSGGSNTYINLAGAQPQLPPTPTTSTGYTVVTDSLLVTTYRSSLGNLEMNSGTIWSNIPNGNITLLGTGTGYVNVARNTISMSTETGALVVAGGIGVGGTIFAEEDIHVNGVTIGQGYKGRNNIAIRGTALPQLNNFPNGQESVAIGFDTLTGLSTAYKSVAIGRFAASSGTMLENTIAIGDSALKNIGIAHNVLVGNITAITKASATSITITDHSVSNGDQVYIENVEGMTELNELTCYAKVIDSSTIELYVNAILTVGVNSLSFSNYTTGGTVSRVYRWNDNFAIGSSAGEELVDGEQNFFLGFNVAKNLTTGSYNFFMGHEVAQNMISGNGNISIGGDNLVDGLDDQINIGSAIYYNGNGYLELNADTALGIGSPAASTTFSATVTNATTTTPVVVTAIGHRLNSGDDVYIQDVVGMVELNNTLYWVDVLTADTFSLHSNPNVSTSTYFVNGTAFTPYASGGVVLKNQPSGGAIVLGGLSVTENAIINGPVRLTGYVESNDVTTGTLVVTGGVGISGNVNIGKKLTVEGPSDVTLSPEGATVYITPSLGGSANFYPNATGDINNMNIGLIAPAAGTFTNVKITSSATAINTQSGALQVTGGVGIGGDLWVGGIINGNIAGGAGSASNLAGGSTSTLVYQSAPDTTAFLSIGNDGDVLSTDGTYLFWAPSSSGTATTATNADNILVSSVNTSSLYYFALTETVAGYSSVHGDIGLNYDKVTDILSTQNVSILGTATSTSTTTGALIVAGGVGVQGSIYSADGNPLEGNKLYTPKVTITDTGVAPVGANVGDFWIDTVLLAHLQYIQDGTSTFWIQVTSI